MRKVMLMICLVVAFTSVALAKDKISDQWNCEAKPTAQHSLDVGDQTGHAYMINQGKCTAAKGSIFGGSQEKDGVYTQFNDVQADGYSNHGVLVVTTAGGDKLNYDYQGTNTTKDGKFQSGTNKWTITDGTGKLKGIKGKGSCKGKANSDGSSTWDCEGEYSGVK